MHKTRKVKALKLNRETLYNLDSQALARIAGGALSNKICPNTSPCITQSEVFSECFGGTCTTTTAA